MLSAGKEKSMKICTKTHIDLFNIGKLSLKAASHLIRLGYEIVCADGKVIEINLRKDCELCA